MDDVRSLALMLLIIHFIITEQIAQQVHESGLKDQRSFSKVYIINKGELCLS